MKYIVYLTINTVNNKIYVGVHGTNAPDKFDGYIGNSINIFESNPELKYPKVPFHKAIKKYGYNAFKRLTLAIFDTVEEAFDLESLIVNEEFIKRKDTYNVALGGNNPPLHNKSVYLYSLKGEFIKEWDSLTEASKYYNINSNTIGIAANYKRTSAGYLWSFAKYDKLDINEYHTYNSKIPVYLYDNDLNFIKSYESMSECYKDLNITLSRVLRAVALGNQINGYYLSLTLSSKFIAPRFNTIKGNIHQYSLEGNYIQSYLEDDKNIPFNIYEINRAIKCNRTHKGYIWIRGEKLDSVPSRKKTVHTIRKIGQYNSNGDLIKTFNTLRECRKEFPNVSKVLRGQAKHCHGYYFKYLE